MDDRQEDIREAARRWFVLMQDPELGPRERERLARWLEEAPEHRAAWDRVQRLWTRVDALIPALPAERPPARLSRRAMLGGAAAAVAAAGVGGTAFYPALLADHHTGIAERRQIALPDGSTVELGSASALALSGPRARLLQGEAWFSLAPPARATLQVEAAGGRIWPEGTEFNLKLTAGTAQVTAVSGDLSVGFDDAGPVRVGQGRQLRFDGRRVGTVEPADLAVVRAWRQDRLLFRDTPLRDVVAELERYRRGRILVAGSVGAIPVTGMFLTTGTGDALQTIARTLPVRLVQATGLLAVILPA